MTSKSLSEVLGTNVRQLRSDGKITQDTLARTVRGYGLRWSSPRVAELERGSLAVSVPLLIVLAQAFGELGVPVGLPELLKSDKPITLTDTFAATPDEMSALLNGSRVSLHRSETIASGLAESRAARALGLSIAQLELRCIWLWGVSFAERRQAIAGPGASAQAEGHATRQMVRELAHTPE